MNISLELLYESILNRYDNHSLEHLRKIFSWLIVMVQLLSIKKLQIASTISEETVRVAIIRFTELTPPCALDTPADCSKLAYNTGPLPPVNLVATDNEEIRC